jgi:uncharacterized protein (DUF427 family)
MKAIWNGTVLAESNDTEVVEGNHYFPASSIKREYFKPSPTHSFCPWKGTASYYTIDAGGAENADAAWYYPDPKDAAKQIKDRIAFWKGVKVTP